MLKNGIHKFLMFGLVEFPDLDEFIISCRNYETGIRRIPGDGVDIGRMSFLDG